MANKSPHLITIALATAITTAIGAQIALTVQGSSVPITLQSLTAILAGFVASTGGPGVLGMALYLGAAALGAPILAQGAGGLDAVIGDHAGYLAGLLIAPQIGWSLAEWFRGLPRLVSAFVGAFIAHALILALGVAWLVLHAKVSSQVAVDQGLLPFLPGALIKSGVIGVVVALLDWVLDTGRKGRA